MVEADISLHKKEQQQEINIVTWQDMQRQIPAIEIQRS
jgi:hypothetical protein